MCVQESNQQRRLRPDPNTGTSWCCCPLRRRKTAAAATVPTTHTSQDTELGKHAQLDEEKGTAPRPDLSIPDTGSRTSRHIAWGGRRNHRGPERLRLRFRRGPPVSVRRNELVSPGEKRRRGYRGHVAQARVPFFGGKVGAKQVVVPPLNNRQAFATVGSRERSPLPCLPQLHQNVCTLCLFYLFTR